MSSAKFILLYSSRWLYPGARMAHRCRNRRIHTRHALPHLEQGGGGQGRRVRFPQS